MMEGEKIRISAVSYTNSLPFIYGFENSELSKHIIIERDVPSACANKLKSGQVDVGIVPVGALLDFDTYEVISKFCIGASGPVDSVFIFSNLPIEQIKTIRLDAQSRSSNALAKILLNRYWKQDVDYLLEGDADAYVEIGDRTFGKKNRVPYAYDLSVYWTKMTQLPITFALWISTKPLSTSFKKLFDEAIQIGLDHRTQLASTLAPIAHFDYAYYLNHNIDYDYDEAKQKGVSLYLEYLKELKGS